MFVEGIIGYYNPSIKANDFVVSKKFSDEFYIAPIYLDFQRIRKIKTH